MSSIEQRRAREADERQERRRAECAGAAHHISLPVIFTACRPNSAAIYAALAALLNPA